MNFTYLMLQNMLKYYLVIITLCYNTKNSSISVVTHDWKKAEKIYFISTKMSIILILLLYIT